MHPGSEALDRTRPGRRRPVDGRRGSRGHRQGGGPDLEVQVPPRQRPRPESRRQDDADRQLPRRRRADDERPLPLDAVGRPRQERHPHRPRARPRRSAATGSAGSAAGGGASARSAASSRRSRCRASTAASRWRPTGRTAYVSGTPESSTEYDQPPEGTPGLEGDVIHVFRYSAKSGKATRDGVIEVPRAGRHAAAAGLPAHADRPGLVAARPRRSLPTARRCSRRSTSPTAPRSSTPSRRTSST